MTKPYHLEATESSIGIFIEATHPIRVGGITHEPGSVIDVAPRDAGKLIDAGVARRAAATGRTHIPVEEQLPNGIDPLVWRADPRLRVVGQKPTSFVKIADFEDQYPRNR
jgi:hypothetical protein